MNTNRTLILTITIIVLSITMVMTTNAQSGTEPVETTTEAPGYYKLLRDGTDPIKIPFKMHNGKPLLDLEINGEKATLMIDNGVLWNETWLFGSQLVDDLQLKPIEDAAISGTGEGDPTRAYFSNKLKLKFKDIVFYEQPSLVSPPAAGFTKMFPGADGQLCNTFFKHFIVQFDFVNNEVILHDPKYFKYTGGGSILDIVPSESGSNSIPFSFTMHDGRVFTDRVDMDFGGIYTLKIALNNKHKIQLPANSKEAASYGAQGRSPEYKGSIQSMTIGKYKFKNEAVYFGDETTARVHPNNLGIIGLPLFMKFNILFDFINNKLYIEPNSKFDGSFEGDKN